MKIKFCLALAAVIAVTSCQKTSIYFKDNSITEDPNITYWDNYSVALSTYKLDTFPTSNDSVWAIGTHVDPEFGKITASSYAEISRPDLHPFREANIVFDSAVIMLVPNGTYYGDTTKPYTLNVFTLSEYLGNDTASGKTYYNTNFTSHNNIAIGTTTTYVKPLTKDTVFLKVNDVFARDLHSQMKNASSVMTDQSSFRSYLKGFCIETDSLRNQAIYQFATAGSAGILRMYYTVKGLYNENKYFDVNYIPARQYNQVSFNYGNSSFNAFNPIKSQLIESAKLDNKALLNNYCPSLIKIEFPDIHNITQTYPYVKVLKAELEIRVKRSLNSDPYNVPPYLMMYVSNQGNNPASVLTSASGDAMTGDLTVDPLIDNGIKYTYDISGYVNTVLTEGLFSTKSLFLIPYTPAYNGETSRLVLDAQQSDPDVRIKLYVLGL